MTMLDKYRPCYYMSRMEERNNQQQKKKKKKIKKKKDLWVVCNYVPK